MKFSESTYFNPLRHHLLEMPFGTFYFCEKFFVSELNEGAKLGYIPNRINSYSVNPHYWDKADKIYNMIVASAIVSYSTITMMNATIEKHFFSKSIKRCTSLTEAVDWILNLKELRDCQI